jgi:vesicle coat complex subunit
MAAKWAAGDIKRNIKGRGNRPVKRKEIRTMKNNIIISGVLMSTLLVTGSFSHATLHNTAVDAARTAHLKVSELDRMKTMLRSSDPYVRAEAAQDLGEMGGPEVAIPLIKALEDDNIYVRAYAAEALGKIKQYEAVMPLIHALNDEEEFVQTHIVQSLGELKDPKAVLPLIALLTAEREVIRTHAARALGEIRDPKAIGALITALNDEVCCDHAAEALKKITDQDFGTDYDRWNSWWSSTNQTL